MGPEQLLKTITFHLELDRPLGIIGDPGIGKSSIVHQSAKQYGLPVVTKNLALTEAPDLGGYPMFSASPDGEKVAEMVMQRAFHQLSKEPAIIFLDELFQAPVAVMNAAAPIILEKRVGDMYLHPDCRVVFASNKASNKAGTSRVPSHIPNRATIVELTVSNEDFLLYAIEQGVPEVIPAFLTMRPNLLHDFDPNRMINATPRQWMGVAKMLEQGVPENIKLECIAGCVGEGAAAELIGFERIMGQIPTREQILMDPKGVKIPEDPSARWAITGMLSQNATVNNFGSIIEFMKRMPEELQVVLVKQVMRLQPAVTGTKAYVEWAVRFQQYLR